MLQCNHCFPPPLIFLSYYTLTVFPALSALRQPHACSNSNASTTKPIAFALPHTLDPTSRTISPKISGTLLLSLPSTANSRHFSSQNISVKQHCPSPLSVCTVCVCMHACVRVCILHIVMLEHLMSTLNNIVQPKTRSYFASHLIFSCFSPFTCWLSVVL